MDLYPQFLDDESQYSAAKIYWQRLFERLLSESMQSNWVIGSVGERSHYPEGNSMPIFNASNKMQMKGISVVQAKHSKGLRKIVARTDTFGANYYANPMNFLHIWCELSPKSGELAEQLIAVWIRPETSTKKMQKIITNLDKRVSSTGEA